MLRKVKNNFRKVKATCFIYLENSNEYNNNADAAWKRNDINSGDFFPDPSFFSAIRTFGFFWENVKEQVSLRHQ